MPLIGISDAGVLVDKTYDQSLMSINYARAAATDFAAMRAAFARHWIADRPGNARQARATRSQALDARRSTDDLDGRRAALAVGARHAGRRQRPARGQRPGRACASACSTAPSSTPTGKRSTTMPRKVDEQIDLLINYTAGDGFIYRQIGARDGGARHQAQYRRHGARACCCRRWWPGRWRAASSGRSRPPPNVAERIATRQARRRDPDRQRRRTRRACSSSMGLMRDNIKAMMDREVAQRRSAQARLADALESSQEGVVVVDADDCIALANAQAADFLGVSPELLKPGTPIADLTPALAGSDRSAGACCAPRNGDAAATDEIAACRRALAARQPQRHARRRLHRRVQRHQPIETIRRRRLRQTNLRLDAALDNMSQGLCLFDAQNRLEVVNRRFFEIFGLPRDHDRARHRHSARSSN